MPTGALKGVVKCAAKSSRFSEAIGKKQRIAEAEKDHDFAGE